MAKRSIRFNFLSNTAYQLLNILTAVITAPYLARVVGANGVGIFSFTQSVAQVFSMFVLLGISTYGVRLIAYAGQDREERSQKFWSSYLLQLTLGSAVLLLYLGYSLWIAENRTLALLWGLFILSAVFDVSWLLFGVEEFVIPTVRSFITKILSVAAIFAFVKGPEDLWIYVLAIAGAFFANQVLIWPFVRRYVDFRRPTAAETYRHLMPSLGLFIPVVAVSIYTIIDKVMLGTMSSVEQLGFFEYSEKFSRIPLQLVTAMTTVMLPRMAFHFKSGNREQGLALLRTSLSVMMFCALPMAFGIAALAPEFMPWFLGKEFAPSVILMIVLAAIIPIISASNVLGRQYLLPMGRDREYTISLIIGAAVNLGVNFALIPQWAALGAVIGTVAAELAILVVQAIMVRLELPLWTYVLDFLPYAAISLVMYLIMSGLSSAGALTFGLVWMDLTASAVIGIMMYVLGALGYFVLKRDALLSKMLLPKFRRRGGTK